MLDGTKGTICVLGATASGKTVLVRSLIKTFGGNFTDITILTGSEYTTDWNGLPVTPIKITNDSVDNVIQFAYACKKRGHHRRILLILDDWIGSISSTKGSVFSKLATSGRHLGISTVWICQHQRAIDPKIRLNLTEWIVMGCQTPKVIDGLTEVVSMPKATFLTKYRKLKRYDFVYINTPDQKIIFSNKVTNDVFQFSPLGTKSDYIDKLISHEAMHLRSEGREETQMCNEPSSRKPILQETQESRHSDPGYFIEQNELSSPQSNSSNSSSSSNSIPLSSGISDGNGSEPVPNYERIREYNPRYRNYDEPTPAPIEREERRNANPITETKSHYGITSNVFPSYRKNTQ